MQNAFVMPDVGFVTTLALRFQVVQRHYHAPDEDE